MYDIIELIIRIFGMSGKVTLTFIIVWVQCQCSSELDTVWVQTATYCPSANKAACVGADQTTTEEYTCDTV